MEAGQDKTLQSLMKLIHTPIVFIKNLYSPQKKLLLHVCRLMDLVRRYSILTTELRKWILTQEAYKQVHLFLSQGIIFIKSVLILSIPMFSSLMQLITYRQVFY